MDWLDGSPEAEKAPVYRFYSKYAASTRVGVGGRARSRVFGAVPPSSRRPKASSRTAVRKVSAVESSAIPKDSDDNAPRSYIGRQRSQRSWLDEGQVKHRPSPDPSASHGTPEMTLGKQKGIIASFIKLHGHKRQARSKAIAALGTPDTPDTHDSMDRMDTPVSGASNCSGASDISGPSMRGTPIASGGRSGGSAGHPRRSRVFVGGRPNVAASPAKAGALEQQHGGGHSRPPRAARSRKDRKKRQPLMKWCLAQALQGQSKRRKQKKKGRASVGGASDLLAQALLARGRDGRAGGRVAGRGATSHAISGFSQGGQSRPAVGREGILAMRQSARGRAGMGAGAAAGSGAGTSGYGSSVRGAAGSGRDGDGLDFDAAVALPAAGTAAQSAAAATSSPGTGAALPLPVSAASSPGGASVRSEASHSSHASQASAGSQLSIQTDSSQSSGELISQALQGLSLSSYSRWTTSRADIQLLRRSSVMPQHLRGHSAAGLLRGMTAEQRATAIARFEGEQQHQFGGADRLDEEGLPQAGSRSVMAADPSSGAGAGTDLVDLSDAGARAGPHAPASGGVLSIPEDALTAVMEFAGAHELLHLLPRVSRTWRSISASVYGWRAAEAVCFEDPDLEDDERYDECEGVAGDDSGGVGMDDQQALKLMASPTAAMQAAATQLEYAEGSVADGLALCVSVLSKMDGFRMNFPWGRFLSEGAYKQVYRVLHAPSEQEEAVAFMDASLIAESGQWDVVRAEIRCSNLVSQLVRSGACPHFVQVKQIAMMGHGAPEDTWGTSECRAPLGALRPPLRQQLLRRYRQWIDQKMATQTAGVARGSSATASSAAAQPKPRRPPALPRPVTTRAGAKADAEARAPKALPVRRMTRAMTRRLQAQGKDPTLLAGIDTVKATASRSRAATRAVPASKTQSVASAANPGAAGSTNSAASADEAGLRGDKVKAARSFCRGRVWQMLRMELCEGGDIEELLRGQEDVGIQSPAASRSKLAAGGRRHPAIEDPAAGVAQARDLMLQMLASAAVARQRLKLRHYDIKLLNFLLARTSQLDVPAAGTTSGAGKGGKKEGGKSVRLTYGTKDGQKLAVDVQQDGWVVKMADFGTADWSPGTLGAPVTVAQFTTFENSAPELMVQGDAARQGYALDTWQLGLCFLHVLTGGMPYEEIMEDVLCPDAVRAGLEQVWKHGKRRGRDPSKCGSYSVVWTADRSDEDGVLADTLWRYVVLLGAPEVGGGLACHGQAGRIVRLLQRATGAEVLGKGDASMQEAVAQYYAEAAAFGLEGGSHELIARARARMRAAPGARELLLGLLAWDPAARPSLAEAASSLFFRPSVALASAKLPKGWAQMRGGDFED